MNHKRSLHFQPSFGASKSMECINPDCKGRERFKQLFSFEERASGDIEFCPFCGSPLVFCSEALEDGKNDLQESQGSHEATSTTKEGMGGSNGILMKSFECLLKFFAPVCCMVL